MTRLKLSQTSTWLLVSPMYGRICGWVALTWNASQNASWAIFQLALITLRHVGLDVAVAQVPALEVVGELADEVLERAGVRIGVDEHEPGPRADLDLGQRELLGA